jgi:hypothetical protein
VGEVSQIAIRLASARAGADELKYAFRMAMQLGGVDVSGLAMLVSSAHTSADADQTISAFDASIGMLEAEGMI